MSAAELRQAAAFMRLNAPLLDDDLLWDGAATLAVAEWLEGVADRNESGSDLDWPHPRDLDAATAIARAYLGERR